MLVTVQYAPCETGVHVDDDDRGMGPVTAWSDVLVGDIELPVLLVDHDVLRLRPLNRDRFRHVIDALQLVGARIPADQLRRDLRPEPHVDDPHDSILVRSKTQHVIQIVIGPLSWGIPFSVGERLKCRRRRQPRHTYIGIVKWMVAEDHLIVWRKRNVAHRLGQSREYLRANRSFFCICCTRDYCRHYQGGKSNPCPNASQCSLLVFLVIILTYCCRSGAGCGSEAFQAKADTQGETFGRIRSLRERSCALICPLTITHKYVQ